MKTAFFIFLIAVLLGGLGWRYYERSQSPSLGQSVDHLADKTRDLAGEAKDAVTTTAEDWKLTPANIKEELARTGRVVRSKAKDVGEIIDDARIIAVIKGKYLVDRNLSTLAITVNCRDGEVRLTGSVSSEEHIGRAVTLALQTGGVRNVISQLVIRS